jgi:ABC-type transporter Mla MlaB component
MNKRNKASSSASRSTRGGHLSGQVKAAPQKARGKADRKARGTKLNSKGSEPASRKAAPDKQPASNTLALAAECTVADAGSLKERLTDLLNEPRAVTLDVTALQRIDTAGLQVITAFIRERAGLGLQVEWHGTAPVLATAAQLLGLTSLLELPA